MLRQWFEGLSAGTCLVLWDFKTDRWPPVPIPKPFPRFIDFNDRSSVLSCSSWCSGKAVLVITSTKTSRSQAVLKKSVPASFGLVYCLWVPGTPTKNNSASRAAANLVSQAKQLPLHPFPFLQPQA